MTQDELIERAKQLAPNPTPTDVGVVIICIDLHNGNVGWVSNGSTEQTGKMLADIFNAPIVDGTPPDGTVH